MQKTVRFLDTTLRDGEQTPGVSFHLNEKVEFAKALEAKGIRATVRRKLGSDINASCGQLRLQKLAADQA